jgi:MFS superfamily sulfate permease-like transporter
MACGRFPFFFFSLCSLIYNRQLGRSDIEPLRAHIIAVLLARCLYMVGVFLFPSASLAVVQVLIGVDISKQTTFKNVERWLAELRENASSNTTFFLLVAIRIHIFFLFLLTI